MKQARNSPAKTISAGHVILFTTMRVRLYSNNVEAPLTPFIGSFVGNVCSGIAASLKVRLPIRTLEYELEGAGVRLSLNGAPVLLDHEFSRIIVIDTVRGMLRHLKMEDRDGFIRIEIDMER